VTPLNLKINHVRHIGLPVTNLTASDSFYEKLGFVNVMASGFDCKGGRGSVVMMQQGKLIIELYQMPETELQEIRNRNHGHIDHIVFDLETNVASQSQQLVQELLSSLSSSSTSDNTTSVLETVYGNRSLNVQA